MNPPKSSSHFALTNSGLITLAYRTYFFRHFLKKPDLKAEKILSAVPSQPKIFRSPTAIYNCVHLGQRAWHIDQILSHWLARNPNGQIVNLGCGLETVFDRLPGGEWRGYNVDFSEPIQTRKSLALDTDTVINIESSIFDFKWTRSLQPQRPVIFVLSGVYSYLEPQAATQFLRNLRSAFPHGELIFDTHSRAGRTLSNLAIRLNDRSAALFKSTTPRAWLRTVEALKSIDLGDIHSLPVLDRRTKLLAWFARRIRFSHIWWVRWSR